ncbi:DJ-1/PfpI family protein [Flavobacterium piscisymbiosum]|uniref:DJ-1/PfpI family protein n=1 Tax=Flavobacterium piscisymbiosum TaxID=2893753 RepID=A0ABS8MDZ2_9FLAO|nr:DJ-1/PfpI family protein [Flavobacterium sp. F-30]MCC9063717.1 DJ-1/PfpI family protein [Flavobacterium sp. F-30]
MKKIIPLLMTLLTLLSHISCAQTGSNSGREKIDPYKPRFGRDKPVVAVVALNEGTELMDFMLPYGVLGKSGTAQVISVSTRSGNVTMSPLTFSLQTTISEFDSLYPNGADYIIVPNIRNTGDQDLVNWVRSQGEKGGTVVSICLGAMAVANTGLMDGHRATSYFPNFEERTTLYPKVKWEKNIRYVSDGKIVSSAGISASIPVSIALVEAIAGHKKALSLAQELGVKEWGTEHNSEVFVNYDGPGQFGAGSGRIESTGIRVEKGDEEIAIAITADALRMTGRTSVKILAGTNAPVALANGIRIIPDKVADTDELTRVLPPFGGEKAVRIIDRTLEEIADRYGRESAYSVGRIMEYPGFAKYKTAK